MFERSSGILLHISSLPGDYGIGDFGKEAYKFVDFLADSGQKLWQILPLGPTGYGNSPYQCYSAFAGNFIFIDLEQFLNEYCITKEELEAIKEENNKGKADYSGVNIKKERCLKKLSLKFFQRVSKDRELRKDFKKFMEENSFWLDNYSLYMVFKEKFCGRPWNTWPQKYRNKNIKKIELSENEKERFDYYRFAQYIFYKQWFKLKEYANRKGVRIIGDIPIFVATDSADTWGCKKIFQFTKSGKPKKVAGCPPDYFSRKGQLWGNVVYNWKEIEKTGYQWWVERISFSLKIYDVLRIDHFRGFESYWSIRSGKKDAVKGKWEKGPGMRLFRALEKKLGSIPLIVEDLGYLTPPVKRLLRRTGYPGMKVFQFAFENEDNEYLPHKYSRNCVAYAGTHDNDTIVGWYNSLDPVKKYRCDEYLKKWLTERGRDFWNPINWRVIETLWSSEAGIVIIQMQDLLGLGSEARMNIPGTVGDNWNWMLEKNSVNEGIRKRLAEVTEIFNR